MAFPLSTWRLYVQMSMTWVTCDTGVEAAARVAVTAYLVAGGSGLLLGGVY